MKEKVLERDTEVRYYIILWEASVSITLTFIISQTDTNGFLFLWGFDGVYFFKVLTGFYLPEELMGFYLFQLQMGFFFNVVTWSYFPEVLMKFYFCDLWKLGL